MVFDKYSRQVSGKPASIAPSSSYLSRLAGQVGAGGGSSSTGLSGSSQLWRGSDSKTSTRASIEQRLRWVETAFKKGENQPLDENRAALSSVRNRINALLTHDLSPKVRTELELVDRELAKIL